ncbi:MAG TPA: hypothetical protein VEU95_09590 [Micropepsaceae bacterium]|nr:hypothetical protein [Micropepsaceae bacterium]
MPTLGRVLRGVRTDYENYDGDAQITLGEKQSVAVPDQPIQEAGFAQAVPAIREIPWRRPWFSCAFEHISTSV